jgi:hypothetical protein
VISAKEITIEPCPISEVRQFIEEHHYSHSINGVKVSCCFKVLHFGNLVGGVLFGQMSTTAWKRFGNAENSVLELRRLVLLDEVGRNSESKTIGYCLRWVNKNMKQVRVIVSYADPYHGHSGVIYRASNFTYCGLSASDIGYRDKETGKTYHSRALRTKYKGQFKPFVVRLRAKLDNGELEKIKLPGKHCFTYRYT